MYDFDYNCAQMDYQADYNNTINYSLGSMLYRKLRLQNLRLENFMSGFPRPKQVEI